MFLLAADDPCQITELLSVAALRGGQLDFLIATPVLAARPRQRQKHLGRLQRLDVDRPLFGRRP